jgi:hypothetical protein
VIERHTNHAKNKKILKIALRQKNCPNFPIKINHHNLKLQKEEEETLGTTPCYF